MFIWTLRDVIGFIGLGMIALLLLCGFVAGQLNRYRARRDRKNKDK